VEITILCTDASHPVNRLLVPWAARHAEHRVSIVRSRSELPGGDILFLVSCAELVRAQERALYGVCLVLHASALPLGRGWSPHIWQLLEGARRITLTLLEAEDKVDSGRIWQRMDFDVPPDALWDEINERLFAAEMELMDVAVNEYGCLTPQEQDATLPPTYYQKRTPEDSRISSEKSIASQFDAIRVCDPERYPAFFELRGCRYKLVLEKMHD